MPGRNRWRFEQRGKMKQTVAADIDLGDCFLLSGKVLRVSGGNKMRDERNCTLLTVIPKFLDSLGSTSAGSHPSHGDNAVEARAAFRWLWITVPL